MLLFLHPCPHRDRPWAALQGDGYMRYDNQFFWDHGLVSIKHMHSFQTSLLTLWHMFDAEAARSHRSWVLCYVLSTVFGVVRIRPQCLPACVHRLHTHDAQNIPSDATPILFFLIYSFQYGGSKYQNPTTTDGDAGSTGTTCVCVCIVCRLHCNATRYAERSSLFCTVRIWYEHMQRIDYVMISCDPLLCCDLMYESTHTQIFPFRSPRLHRMGLQRRVILSNLRQCAYSLP